MALKAKKPKETKPRKSKIIIFGKPGSGKTWLSMDFPKCYYIDCEGGASRPEYQAKLDKAGGVYLGFDDNANDFDTVLEQFKSLATEKHEFKTVVIGSITKLFQTVIADEAEKLGKKDVFGASKKPAIAYMRQLFKWIQRVDMNVILEAHEISEWALVEGKREEIGQRPDCWDKLLYELDLIFQIQKSGPERTLKTTKSRLSAFPENEVFKCSYEDFASRYGKEFLEGDSIPIELASKEQVESILKLLEILHISEDEQTKILNKANASDWNEINTEHAEKTINWLKGKIE